MLTKYFIFEGCFTTQMLNIRFIKAQFRREETGQDKETERKTKSDGDEERDRY